MLFSVRYLLAQQILQNVHFQADKDKIEDVKFGWDEYSSFY